MDSKEIRQLKLEKARAIYENRYRQSNLIYWVIIPLFITILISPRTEIGDIFRPIFKLIDIIPNDVLKSIIFLTILIGSLTMVIFSPVIGMKIGKILGNIIRMDYESNLNNYIKEIDQLISEAENKKSKTKIIKKEPMHKRYR